MERRILAAFLYHADFSYWWIESLGDRSYESINLNFIGCGIS